MKRLLWIPALFLLLLAPLAAQASDGWVTANVSLRAGPDSDYPRIDILDAGSRVEILGCIDGWEWCDVVAYGERGWVAGQFIQFDYEGRHVYIHEYGPQLGIPIIAFALGAYWGEHYHDRPWYQHRDYWEHSSHGNRPHYSYSTRYPSHTGRSYAPQYQHGGGYHPSQPSQHQYQAPSHERGSQPSPYRPPQGQQGQQQRHDQGQQHGRPQEQQQSHEQGQRHDRPQGQQQSHPQGQQQSHPQGQQQSHPQGQQQSHPQGQQQSHQQSQQQSYQQAQQRSHQQAQQQAHPKGEKDKGKDNKDDGHR